MRLPGLLRFKGIKINLISEQHVRSVSYRIGFSCLENQTFTLTLNKCIIKATLIFVWYIDLEKKPLNVLIMLAVSDSYVVQWLRSILNYLPDFHALFVFTTFLRNIKIPKPNVLRSILGKSRGTIRSMPLQFWFQSNVCIGCAVFTSYFWVKGGWISEFFSLLLKSPKKVSNYYRSKEKIIRVLIWHLF